jgi:hypothetical protein
MLKPLNPNCSSSIANTMCCTRVLQGLGSSILCSAQMPSSHANGSKCIEFLSYDLSDSAFYKEWKNLTHTKSLAWLERHSITAVLQGHLMNRLQLYEISELAKLYALHVLHRVFRMLLPHFLATLPRTKISRKSEGLLVTFRASTAFRRRYSEVK